MTLFAFLFFDGSSWILLPNAFHFLKGPGQLFISNGKRSSKNLMLMVLLSRNALYIYLQVSRRTLPAKGFQYYFLNM